ncbi:MAG: hypothetical protein IPG81_32805 [Sandaracinaceae bacterium]|nr:hypothetical protein [Sandaracinaceae bacterium]
MPRAPALSAMLIALALPVALAASAAAQGPWWAPRYGEPLEASSVAERTRAAQELGRETRRGRAVQATQRLVTALHQERHPAVRDAIVGALARLGHPDALEALEEELQVSRARELQRLLLAIAAIAEAGSPRAATLLVEQLSTRGRSEFAREALRRAGLVTLPALLRALRDATEGRAEIARALGETRSHQATPGLLQVLAGEWQPTDGVAVLDALAVIADPRARGAVLAALADARDPRVERAALAALEALGAGPGADGVEQRLQSSDSGVAQKALAALLQVDPERGAVALTASVAASDPAVVQQAAELALAWRHPLVVPVLFGLVNEGSRAERAMSALAELDGGAGLPVLLHVARENAQHASTARHALAMALRRWAPALSRAQRRDAFDEVRREPGTRAWLLRALAGDEGVQPLLLHALGAEAAITRLQAAHALSVLGRFASAGAGDALLTAAQGEASAHVFRELAYAHVGLGQPCSDGARGLGARLHAADTRDAALLLMAGCGAQLSPRQHREVAQLARRQLASASPTARATAAWALARAGDPLATRTLLARAETEVDPWVRRAFARAVWVLASPVHAAEARSLARVESDTLSAAWLRDAGRGEGAARSFHARGDEILRVQIRPVDPVPEGLVVEVRLTEGRVLRVTTFPDGLLVVPDLAAGVADVEVVPSPPLDTEQD